MSILVTGGAGYIGSHCVAALVSRGIDTVVVDNLSKGHREALKGGRLYVGDVGDRVFLEDVFRREHIEAVIHFAAFSLVGEKHERAGAVFPQQLHGRPDPGGHYGEIRRTLPYLFLHRRHLRRAGAGPHPGDGQDRSHQLLWRDQAGDGEDDVLDQPGPRPAVCALRYFNAAAPHPSGASARPTP